MTTPYDLVRARAEEMDLHPRDKTGGFGCDCPLPGHKAKEGHVWVYRTRNGGYKPTCKGGQGHTEEELVDTFGIPSEGEKPTRGVCTLEAYAELKRLPLDFLRELGLRTKKYCGEAAIEIPLLDESGVLESTIFRTKLAPRELRWKPGAKAIPYGLSRLAEARAAGYIVVVEGQSDCHTLWHRGVPAMGLAGAGGWTRRVESAIGRVPAVFVLIEPGKAGADLAKRLAASEHRERIRLVRLVGAKDPSELHCKDNASFPTAWKRALETAPRLVDEMDQERAARAAAARERCANLLSSPDILAEFRADAAKLIAGEQASVQIIYLAGITRLFNRPVSVLDRGPSGSGKSHATGKVLRFFPESAYHSVTSMSARAIVFSEESFEHRFLYLFEAAGMEDETLQYIIRSLLSEGCVRYDVVEKEPDGKLATRTIVKPGPTGLILTSTRASINPENETRLLAIATDDTRAQTESVMRHIAERAVEDAEPDVDFARWHALQVVLESIDPRVTIPFAPALAAKTRGVAVRLRRDFTTMISLVKAHALLHHATRERDAKGRIVATLGDYEAVRLLVEEFIGEGVGASVSDRIKETVFAVEALTAAGGTCTVTEVAKQLAIDKSAASGRVNKALVAGYLENENAGKRGVAYKLKLGTSLPEGVNVFPTRAELEAEAGHSPEAKPPRGFTADEVRAVFDTDDGGPCPACGRSRFYINGSAPPVCGDCHPPAKPESVRWIEPTTEEVAADAH